MLCQSEADARFRQRVWRVLFAAFILFWIGFPYLLWRGFA